MVRFAAYPAALLVLAGCCLAAGKSPVYLISCHVEGESGVETATTLQDYQINGEKRYFRKLPVLTQRNFKAYWAFPSEDGRTWGAVFWLDSTGQKILESLGVGNRGQYLAIAYNREAVDVQTIDKAPPDGRIVVWKGLPPELFKIINREKKIRPIGATDAASVATRRAKDTPAPRTSEVPPGAPLPDDTVIGRIDPATLDSATRDIKKPAVPAKKPSKSSQPAGADPIPFRPDSAVERAELAPLPEPGVKRN